MVVPFNRHKVVDSEVIAVMSEAFRAAKEFMRANDARSIETLAMRVVTMAADGRAPRPARA